MRRVAAIVVLALGCVLRPSQADAYFWTWLDDLSGPKYAGFLVELQVQCNVKRVGEYAGAPESLQVAILADQGRYKLDPARSIKPDARDFYKNASAYAAEALKRANEAETATGEDRIQLLYEATVWKRRAAAHFAWAESIQNDVPLNLAEKPDTYPTDQRILLLPGLGFNYSLCKYTKPERDRNFLRVSVGLAFDIKDDHEYGTSKMLTHGASYHFVASPWVTVGAGGGIATFLPSDRPAFSKWYVQPWMFDIRPGNWCKNADVRSPWRHFVYVRISALVFPQGFEAGRFTATSPEYGPELVNAVGVHFDLTPVIRGHKGNW